ncbi:MAG: glycosyltransferase family 61 protein [Verrucomicrobiaceae bacterium]|nr:glycosyltransferase family 61 protein [Verrucomicrobiaceae bacterium]
MPDSFERIDEAGQSQLDDSFECRFHEKDMVPSFEWPNLILATLHDAWMTGDQGHVFLHDGTHLSICPSLRHLPERKIRRPLTWLARRLPGVYFHLTGVDHENHAHFLMQHLPRLLAARKHLGEPDGELKVIVAPGHKRWQSRYLNYFGISEDRIVEASVGTICVEKLLYVPMAYGNTYLCNPRFYREIRDGFTRNIPAVAEGALGPILFISRQDAPDRRLTNEAEIVSVCAEVLGSVQVVQLGRLKLDEQIRLCATARLIIGPQGQGMGVVLFARGGLFVVMEYGENFHLHGWCRAFCDTASALGIKTLRLISGGGFDASRDWSYPADKFRQELVRLRDLVPTLFPPSS